MRAATFFLLLLGGFAKSISSMMKVANPIYDIVFKYLLEDERIASDAKIRHDMNVEDEFFSVIEKRDTDSC